MNHLLSYTNNLAIGLSAFCVAHCLASPVLIVLLPSLSVIQLDNESFHIWLLIGVIPSSLISLMMGCRQHYHYRVLILGLCGLLFLVAAIFMESFQYGAAIEKVFTVIGALIIAVGHGLNFRLCRRHKSCECEENQ